jgi:hypothetical protein
MPQSRFSDKEFKLITFKPYPFPSGEENIEKVIWAHQITADPRDRHWGIFQNVQRFTKRRFTPGPNLMGQ